MTDAIVASSRGRTYPMPGTVSAEARRGLDWAHGRSDVSKHSVELARTLVAGGALTQEYVARLGGNALRGPGWKPGEEGYPSLERIEWACRGGDAGAKWSEKIIASAAEAEAKAMDALLSSMGYDESYVYLGLLDDFDSDIIRSVLRASADFRTLHRWDGLGWKQIKKTVIRHKDLVELDRDLLGFTASALRDGDGVLLSYADPITFLPLTPLLASIDEPLMTQEEEFIYAIVDATDTSAVLDVIKIAPGPKVFIRENASWVISQETLDQFMGPNPPPIVELDGAMLDMVLEQVDAEAIGATADQLMEDAEASSEIPEDDAATDAEEIPSDLEEDPLVAAGGGVSGKPRAYDEKAHKRDAFGRFAQKPKASMNSDYLTDAEKAEIRDYIVNGKKGTRFQKYADERTKGKSGGSSKSSSKGKSAAKKRAEQEARRLAAKREAQKSRMSQLNDDYKTEQMNYERDELRAEAAEMQRRQKFEAEVRKLGDALAGNPDAEPQLLAKYQELLAKEQVARRLFNDQRATRRLAWRRRALWHRKRIHNASLRASAAFQEDIAFIEALERIPLLAAGGADRNRGNAETLRRYWLHGKGALKIRWGTKGDWRRCVAHLTKYLGPRAKGYCSLRHKEATGMWTSDKAHRKGVDSVVGSAAAITHAGLAVQALDTGRVLMLQRAMDEDDPAAGMWEFPGGGIDEDQPYDAAVREWSEETGSALPQGELVGSWIAPNAIYQGFVYRIAREDLVNVNVSHEDRDEINPDDPKGKEPEVVAWFDVDDLIGMPSLRPEVLDTDWRLFLRSVTAGARRVRTPEGAEHFDQSIGDIIRPDLPGDGVVARLVAPTAMQPTTREAANAVRVNRNVKHNEKIGAIPPGWTDLHLNANWDDPHATILVSGRDKTGKLQALYTDYHKRSASAEKFARLARVLDGVDSLDAALAEDLRGDDLVALVVGIIRATGMRVSSTKKKDATVFGATTLKREHVRIENGLAIFDFVGKANKRNVYTTDEPQVVERLRQLLEETADGEFLFPSVSSDDTISYIRRHTGVDDAKNHDLRTLKANILAYKAIRDMEPPKTQKEYRTRRNQVGDEVAAAINDTRTVALTDYISDVLFHRWELAIREQGLAASGYSASDLEALKEYVADFADAKGFKIAPAEDDD